MKAYVLFNDNSYQAVIAGVYTDLDDAISHAKFSQLGWAYEYGPSPRIWSSGYSYIELWDIEAPGSVCGPAEKALRSGDPSWASSPIETI